MKFAQRMRIARSDGIITALLQGLSKYLTYKQIGILVERLGNTARVDGFTFDTNNPLISAASKGLIVVDGYETQSLQLFLQCFPRNEPLIELGGSLGVVSCRINRRLISPQLHVVVEANPALIPTLQKNRDKNQCQFEILEAALAYGSPTVTFFTNNESTGGSVYKGEGEGEAIQVPTKTLQTIAENARFQRFNLIVDIEGSEFDLIENELDFLRASVHLFLVEIHFFTFRGEEAVYALVEYLQKNGFELLDHIMNNYCFRNMALLKPGH